MGTGIAQVAACAGHRVLLADARPGVAAQAAGQIKAKVADLVARGKLRPASTELDLEAAELAGFGDCGLVIEAVTERLDVKAGLSSTGVANSHRDPVPTRAHPLPTHWLTRRKGSTHGRCHRRRPYAPDRVRSP
jgi:3-hydroxybutyryl-CoA dehydrogenase